MTKDELQKKAEELSTLRLNPEKNRARIRDLEYQIIGYERGFLRKRNGNAYFPLIGAHYDKIPYEEFSSILNYALLRSLREYNPEKGKFVNFLVNYHINFELKNYFEGIKKDKKNIYSGEFDEEKDEAIKKAILMNFEEEFFEIYHTPTMFEVFCKFGRVLSIQEREMQNKSRPEQKRRLRLKGFYTFDLISISNNKEYEHEFEKRKINEQNELLFPLMEEVVVRYLLIIGEFNHIRCITDGTVIDEKRLKNRNITMQECYGISKPTVVEDNKTYKDLFYNATGLRPNA